ncbi:MAG: ADP-forming succinate--CoA ligase subunit beta [Thermogutta sp.]|nr:ADP-forming succinate--CoA ligase subunit beta [Thermogutta sp.]
MKIHEYQAKALLARYEVEVPRGEAVETPGAAAEAFRRLNVARAVVKAQIHAGGRGKGTFAENPARRGVQSVGSPEEAEQTAAAMLGKTLVTVQTGPQGRVVRRVLVEAGCAGRRELYLGLVVDRNRGKPVLIASAEGGVEIETVAARRPEAIFHEPVDPWAGLRGFQVRKLAKKLGLDAAGEQSAAAFLPALARCFLEQDCSLLEINPTVVAEDGTLLALDAKINFDDNAAYRHPEWTELRDLNEEEPTEVRAQAAGLSYVKLDGNIGCLVNGAGLAMSTMDLIMLHGGKPANFLDVGGGADVPQVTEAFRILLSDAGVRAVLVNIFGGIMRCTTIAEALIAAYQTVGVHVPLVVRLEGTEVQAGREILAKSGLNIIAASDLTDAARKVVAACNAAVSA